MSKRVKFGLVGAGVFAGYHANKLSVHPEIEFIGVFDPDQSRAAKIANQHNIKVLSADALYAQSEAIIIACPASFHGEMALKALKAKCHCLIEKPLAVSLDEAMSIVELADTHELVVQVGHQERMVLKAIGLLDIAEKPLAISALRQNPYSQRGTDTSVTLDLMTHDIDICTALFGRAPDRVLGWSKPVVSKTPDKAEAELHYDKARVQLKASRIAEHGARRMAVTYASGQVHIDFNTKTLINDSDHDLNTDFGSSELAQDSLGAATQLFVAAIMDRGPVLVSAQDGLIAVNVATQIDGGLA